MSPDQVDRQNEFSSLNNLGFPLLSDPKGEIARQFGVKRFGPLPPKRVTFVISEDSKVLGVIKSETNMNSHADEALEVLKSRADGEG